ncbi:MAG: DUF4349 domain-containing protein [Actinobacteria bacterium]|nr:DUF4349 domain-containing protein [Actinomycetota bacterium]
MSGRKWLIAAASLTIVTLIVSAAVLGCGESGIEAAGDGVAPATGKEDVKSSDWGADAEKVYSGEEQAARAQGEGVPAPTQETSSVLEQSQLKVIKTALVRMELGKGDYGSVREDAVAAAKAVGGYVEDESSSRDGDGFTHATLTLRVPADKFDELLEEVSSLGEVTSSQVKTEDVSEEYVDLESRLRHLETQEQFYLSLISKAQTIQEMISIREHLDSIQLEKERLQGRKNFLDNQVGFSTITLSVDETSGEEEGEGFWDKVGEAFKSFGRGMKKLAVGFFYALPYLILVGIIATAIWVLARRARGKRGDKRQEAG